MRGYFGIGVEGISKTFNVGNLFRSAHAFDASFVFTVDAVYKRNEGAKADTSDREIQLANVPIQTWIPASATAPCVALPPASLQSYAGMTNASVSILS